MEKTLREALKENKSCNYGYTKPKLIHEARKENNRRLRKLIAKYGWDYKIKEESHYSCVNAIGYYKTRIKQRKGYAMYDFILKAE